MGHDFPQETRAQLPPPGAALKPPEPSGNGPQPNAPKGPGLPPPRDPGRRGCAAERHGGTEPRPSRPSRDRLRAGRGRRPGGGEVPQAPSQRKTRKRRKKPPRSLSHPRAALTRIRAPRSRSSWRRARGSPGAAPLLHPAVPGRAAPPAAAAPAQRGRAAGCRRARSAGAQSPRGAAVTRRSRSPWESRGGRQAPPRVPLSAAAQRVGRPRPEPHPAGAAGTTWQRGAPRALPFRWLRGFAVTLPVSLTAAGRAAAAAFLEPFPPRFEAWLKGTAQYGWRRTDFGTHLKAFRTCGRGSPQRVSQTPPLWPGRN